MPGLWVFLISMFVCVALFGDGGPNSTWAGFALSIAAPSVLGVATQAVWWSVRQLRRLQQVREERIDLAYDLAAALFMFDGPRTEAQKPLLLAIVDVVLLLAGRAKDRPLLKAVAVFHTHFTSTPDEAVSDELLIFSAAMTELLCAAELHNARNLITQAWEIIDRPRAVQLEHSFDMHPGDSILLMKLGDGSTALSLLRAYDAIPEFTHLIR